MNEQLQHSDSITEIAKALLEAQNELGMVAENADNPFFRSRYADLGEHIKTIKPAFSKHNLVISQWVIGEENIIGVTTLLMHTSGEWIRSTVSIPLEDNTKNSKAQVAGSIITYLRRYSLAAVANVYSGEDNDGNIEKLGKLKEECIEILKAEYTAELTAPAIYTFLQSKGKNCDMSMAAEIMNELQES